MSYLIKAGDIVTAHKRGIGEIRDGVVDVCNIVIERPSMMSFGHKRLVYAAWMELAEAGHLRGIRNAVKRDVCEVA